MDSLKTWAKVRRTQFHQFSESFDRDLLRQMLGDVILNLTELANGQPAAIGRRLAGNRARVFLDEMRGEKLGERGDTGRLARHARGQKLRAGQADGPQDFIATKIIHHLHAVCAARITRLKRGQERLDRDVDGKIVEFFTGRRLEAHFVRRARARDEQVAPADLPRDPRTTHVAFPEFRHAPEVAGNVGFWGGGHEKTIHHARKPPAPGI